MKIKSFREKFLDKMNQVLDNNRRKTHSKPDKRCQDIQEAMSRQELEPDMVNAMLKGFSAHCGTKLRF